MTVRRKLLEVVPHELGSRCYVKGRRVHHGLFGCVLIAAGVAMCWSDRHDAPWLRDNEPRLFEKAR